MSLLAIMNLVIFAGMLSLLYQLTRLESFVLSKRVFVGLLGGTLFGFYLQLAFAGNATVMDQTLEWTNVVANGFVAFLRMIIMPLILITMIAAVLKVEEIKSLGKIGGTIVGVLMFTTVIAALIGILMASVFGLDASDLAAGGAAELARAEVLEARQGRVADFSYAALLVSFIPTNIFSDLSGDRSMSTIGVVVFGLIFGIAALLVCEDDSEHGKRILAFVDTTQAVIMRLVKIVMNLTPYGVLALMTRTIATQEGDAIMNMITFVIASYVAIALMFMVHALMIFLLGHNVKSYFQKVWPVLTFAFVTRSSAATIPLTIRAQIEELKVPAPIANISAAFGATIGQNGCAGIYPAMLAVMVAPTVGVDVDLGFIVTLLLFIAIGSFGIAGVGGGATNAALVVFSVLGFPVTIVALLISIEPLIDMARTALNVNGAITTGLITNRFVGDKAVASDASLPDPGLQEL